MAAFMGAVVAVGLLQLRSLTPLDGNAKLLTPTLETGVKLVTGMTCELTDWRIVQILLVDAPNPIG